ncbi:DNA polymerase III subunit gamma/tau [Desulfomarina profundi]|uniref:DNA polymerase III subunit gamma/tau n=1 Tax=Desulfomarina profundi TaxID=2772557 RepID=A0A8D5FH05_9BACT|nr:DNA polymerase III subunit gamma/tau [Desulfomarina profundi]BCL60466.1 DNA polymerase III subunit gamma/tau [Desulfomarina profundi]
MSYLVLARKSRPQTFDQVIGQRSVVKTLQNSIARRRVAHAILFSGVRGVGKTTLARIMAKALNCQSEVSNPPCDDCTSCREISAGSSIDLYEIDGASNRGIQEIRELKEKLRFLPTSARYKIFIIDEVHMLTTEAFNALLKTLEEPPEHVYFMFATTEIHKIPITILSRCQQYELKRISAEELSDHFRKLADEEGFEIEPAALSLIVREAEGSVRDGLSLLDQMFSFGEKTISKDDVIELLGLIDRDLLMTVARGLLDGNTGDVLCALEDIFNYSIDIKRFLIDLIDQFRALLFSKIDGCAKLIDLPENELAELKNIAADYHPETLHQKLGMLMATMEDIRNSSHPRLALETSFLKIIEAGNVVAVSTLLGQVDKILAGLPVSDPPPPVTEKLSAETPESQATPETDVENVEIIPPKAQVSPPPAAIAEKPRKEPKPEPEKPQVQPHTRDIRKDWLEFIDYVRERKLWMAQNLEQADSAKQVDGELHLSYSKPAKCMVLRQKENLKQLSEFVLDFFQQSIKIRFIVPDKELDDRDANGESPRRKRRELADDPLVIMAAEIFNGQVGNIRIGPRSR